MTIKLQALFNSRFGQSGKEERVFFVAPELRASVEALRKTPLGQALYDFLEDHAVSVRVIDGWNVLDYLGAVAAYNDDLKEIFSHKDTGFLTLGHEAKHALNAHSTRLNEIMNSGSSGKRLVAGLLEEASANALEAALELYDWHHQSLAPDDAAALFLQKRAGQNTEERRGMNDGMMCRNIDALKEAYREYADSGDEAHIRRFMQFYFLKWLEEESEMLGQYKHNIRKMNLETEKPRCASYMRGRSWYGAMEALNDGYSYRDIMHGPEHLKDVFLPDEMDELGEMLEILGAIGKGDDNFLVAPNLPEIDVGALVSTILDENTVTLLRLDQSLIERLERFYVRQVSNIDFMNRVSATIGVL